MSDEADRGFNDSELADIMSEIENLESDFADAVEDKPVSIQDEVDEVMAEAVEAPEMHEEVIENVTPIAELKPVSKPFHSSGAKSSMEFSVEGEMSFCLGFAFSGQHVKVHANGKEGLVIELDGGMKFHIPINHKKAA